MTALPGTKVWVFTTGSYSDETIEAVYADKDLADRALQIASTAGDGSIYEVEITDELPFVRHTAYFRVYAEPQRAPHYGSEEPYVSSKVTWEKNERYSTPETYHPGSPGKSWDRGAYWHYVASGPDREWCVKSVVDRACERLAILAGVTP